VNIQLGILLFKNNSSVLLQTSSISSLNISLSQITNIAFFSFLISSIFFLADIKESTILEGSITI